jgi:hypothetical protein
LQDSKNDKDFMNKSQSIGGLVISVHSVSEDDFSMLCSILAFENSIDGFTVSDLCVVSEPGQPRDHPSLYVPPK